jgi:hypothetical protein
LNKTINNRKERFVFHWVFLQLNSFTMKVYFLLFIVAGVLAGCGSNNSVHDPHIAINSDFENISGWIPDSQAITVTGERAHSGQYSLKVGNGNEYSLTFDKPLRQVFNTRPTKIKISAWALLSSPEANATLVTSIQNPGTPGAKPLLWAAIELAPAVKASGKWVRVSKLVELPAEADRNSRLKIYLWSTNNIPVYIDDLVVRQE